MRSARGTTVVALDRFGDLDLQALCPSVSILRDLGGEGGMAELVQAAERIPAERVVYGAGLENRPDLVARLAAGRTLLGCTPETLRRVRDPALLGAALRAAGLAYPRTFPAAEAAQADRARRWLRKPVLGGGGRGVRDWRGGRLSDDLVVQERISGVACSAAAVADGRSAALLGVSEQLIGRRTLGARGYSWCGNLAPPRLPVGERHALIDELRAICAHLAAAFGLRGLFGVDVVWDGERAWVVEVNPRPTASLETIDAAHGVRSFAAHLEAFAGRLPPAGTTPALADPSRGGREGRAPCHRGAARPRHARLGGARHQRRAASRRGDRGRPCGLHPRRDGRHAGGRARRSRGAGRRPARGAPRPGCARCARLTHPAPRAIARRHAAAAASCATTSRPSSTGAAGSSACTGPARSAMRGSPSASLRLRRIARIDGREAGLDAALDEAAAILASARAPLVYGLGRTTCEAQRAAVALAEAIGATIDPAGPLLDGASGLAFQARGASTATLGDVRDRAETVVVWHADPVVTHPRLLERLRLPDPARALVVVAERRTRTAELADTFLELPEERDVEALWTLRALVGGAPLAPAAAEGPLADLAARLRDSRSVAILHHVRGHVAALGLHALVRDLCRVTHAVTVTLRHEANAAGAEDVLAWQTGYPAAVSFAGGGPRANAAELSAPAVLDSGEADAALVVASDPLEHLPAAAAERLRAIPVISIDASDTATARAARIAFTTGAPGVHEAGVVHRLDGVPVPFRAVLESTYPSDREVLMAIAGRIARRGGDPA